MQFNNYTLIERKNRPSVLQRVALQTYFYNGGVLADPYAISGVGVFYLSSNGSPSSVLNSSNLIEDSITPLMWFANSAVATTDSTFNASNYTPGNTASGIYKLSTGRYVAVLDGTLALSSFYQGSRIENSVSAAGDYIDVWQVAWTSALNYNVFINDLRLFTDTTFTLTEPLLLTVKNWIVPKKIKLGSKIALKVPTNITISNWNIDEGVRNIFRDTVITNPQFKILKINNGIHNLQNHVTVSSFANTSSLIDVTSDNTMILSFDTNLLPTHSEIVAGTFGSLTGTYALQVKYTIIDQIFVSDLMYFDIT